MHYYKFNISDWHSSTRHLSLEEEAIYFRLLNHYYDTEKPLPEDTTKLYRRLLLTKHSGIADEMLLEFFELTNGGWEKEKCEEIIKIYQKNKNKNKRNGKKGGRPIGSKGCSIKPNGLIKKTHSQPTGNPNQELLTTNHKPITNKKNGRFSPPLISDVKTYCDQRKNNIDPQDFINHYEANGWIRGKTKIKDWKACVRTWEKNNQNNVPAIVIPKEFDFSEIEKAARNKSSPEHVKELLENVKR